MPTLRSAPQASAPPAWRRVAVPRRRGDPRRESARHAQLDAAVELERICLRQLAAVGADEGLALALGDEHHLARIAGVAQEARDALEPVARQLHIVFVGAP